MLHNALYRKIFRKLILHLFQIVAGSTALLDISDTCDLQSEDDYDSFI